MKIGEVAEATGETSCQVINQMNRMRERGVDLPRVGRGGPGRPRPSRAGIPVPRLGYRFTGAKRKPWLVQVSKSGASLRARCDTEAEAQAAVAAFRAEHS